MAFKHSILPQRFTGRALLAVASGNTYRSRGCRRVSGHAFRRCLEPHRDARKCCRRVRRERSTVSTLVILGLAIMNVTTGRHWPTRHAGRGRRRRAILNSGPRLNAYDKVAALGVVFEGDDTMGSFAQSSKSRAIASSSAADWGSLIDNAERRHFSAYMRKNRGLSISPSGRERASCRLICLRRPTAGRLGKYLWRQAASSVGMTRASPFRTSPRAPLRAPPRVR